MTQLHNLAEAEPFVKAGIPLVASVAWQLEQARRRHQEHERPPARDRGLHRRRAKVIVNDPASTDDSTVKHVYDREQFERAWIPASGGIVYVIRPATWPTPSLTANNS